MLRCLIPRPLVGSLLCCSLASIAWAKDPRPLSDLDALAGLPDRWAEVMDLFDVPGMAVAVVDKGVIYTGGFGIRDPKSKPVTPETLFYIASITKTYTATVICALADEGRIGLDDPVRKHLPRLKLSDPELTGTLTIGDLLCHRNGISSEPIVLLDAYTGEISEDRYYHWLERAEIKGSVEYQNVHFTLLGRVIEAVTGRPWRDEMVERVLTPAKLRRTTGYASRLYGDANHAVPLERAASGWRPLILRKTDKTMHAAGGMGTSAVEGARWLQLHLGDGTLDGKRVLSAETARAMRALQSKNDKTSGTIRKLEGFGYAWMVGSVNGHALCQHGGGYEGASAYMAMLPDDGVGIVVLINASGLASRLGDIVAVDVIERLTGTKSAFDVYERFTQQAREIKEKRAAEAASAPLAAANLQLGQAASRYVGTYSNPWWGTLAVQDASGTLGFRLGDLVLAVRGTATEPDHFVVEEWLEAPTPAFFVVANDNDVEGVTFQHPKFGDVAFRR